jgi:hypothetical protein
MNKLASILILVIILLSFSFCSATKNNIKNEITDNHPFKVTKATYNTWVGGKPGINGFNISITIDNPEIKLDSVFFRNMKTELKQDINAGTHNFVGVFTILKAQHDYNLDKDPLKEYGNQAPNVSLKIPFELKKNEAVVSYLYEGNTHYYKIETLVKIRPIVYPSKNKQ